MSSINGSAKIRGGKLKHWNKMILEWHRVIEDYGRLVGDDAPYWYNERANISILAGAAWRSGKLALEEFGHEKSDKKGQYRGDRWMGRCDLWLKEKKEEASLSDAIKDANDSKQVRGARSVGVSFIPVYILIKYKDEIDAYIDQRIKEAKSVSADCIAWCFPEENRFLTGASGKYYNPGIFMFAKCV